MEETKLSLSPEEHAIVADPEIILTKNGVLQKIRGALDALYGWQLEFLKEKAAWFPPSLLANSGKVSKGENYNGLPYVVLDYPRNFRQGHIFAVRSMFWWGRQVSTTLHVSGEWQAYFLPRLVAGFELLKTGPYHLSYSGNEWEHDVQGESHLPFTEVTAAQWELLLKEKTFIKITAVAPISQLERAPDLWRNAFRELMELLEGKIPGT
ncbi:hypothetical protein [Niabella beijingensis]|uniref:hypothetical protein n=1 Tax=Niabella beijingensis TaxID=2872700 RepID=UPI001CBA8509|nr:hypothetical protein [Niabella beijingensis]MBZ4189867.1 hypothetical protein [Niabella beijingensis]